MFTESSITAKVRVGTAAAAIAAAAALAPASVAHASPAIPAPQFGIGATLGAAIDTCKDVGVSDCLDVSWPRATYSPFLFVIDSDNDATPPLVWFGGPSNPDFQPVLGIVFPNVFNLDFQACALGAGVHLSPYTGTGFIGLGSGC